MRLQLPALQPGTTYAVQISAADSTSTSPWSPVFIFTTDVDTRVPSVPGNRTWVSSGDAFVAEWDATTTYDNAESAYIVSYDIELTANAITKVRSVPNKTDGTRISYTLSFEDNRALFGTPQADVDLRIRAVDNKGLRGNWSPVLNAVNPAPGAPTSPVVSEVQNGLDISWSAPSDTDLIGYNVYVGTPSSFTPSAGNRVFSGDALRFFYTSTTYSEQFIKIRAVDKFGSESTDLLTSGTPDAPVGGDSTPPAVPTGLSATLNTDDSTLVTTADVTWTLASPPTDLAGFLVTYRINGDTAWNSHDVPTDSVTNTTNAFISGLTPYVDYDFRVQAYDFSGNFSAPTAIHTATGATNSAPSQPAAPTIASNTMQAQVVISGNKQAGGAMESDVVHYEVYASTTNGFSTYDNTTMLGIIENGPAITGTFDIPANNTVGTNQTWYFKVIAVDRGGLKSAASPQASSSVSLISTVNIGDATITNAKITELEANKITAGTGLITSLTVKSTLTLGDGVTNGIIESDNYVASTSGFRLDQNGLEINDGTIKATTIELSLGENLVPAEIADFEGTAQWFTDNTFVSQGGMIKGLNPNAVFNNQSLGTIWGTNVANPILYIGSSTTDYNIRVEEGEEYIFSGYFYCLGSVATNVQFKVKWSTGTIETIATSNLPASMSVSAAQRLTNVMTAPAGATGAVLLVESSTWTSGGGYNVDGIQVERKLTASTTPSQWRPPGSTLIHGAIIRTGAITSSADALVWNPTGGAEGTGAYEADTTQPAWVIDTEGDATFNNVLVRGSLVVGDALDIPNSDKYTVASANYLPDAQGWILHGDGNVEFRQVKADSFDGIAIKGQSITADKLTTGVMQADIALAGSFETVGLQQDVLVSTTNASTTVTSSDANFTSFDVGVEIVADGIPSGSTITVVTNSTTVTISNAATATASDVAATLNRGRKVRLTSLTGIEVTEADGTPTVRIPTDSTQDVTFTGTVVATALTINDNLSLQGTNNNIANSAQVTLASASVLGPNAPTAWHYWENYDSWYTGPSGFSAGLYGLEYDSTGPFLIACNRFFSNQFFLFDVETGAFAGNYDMGLADWDAPYGGVTKIGSNYYVLFQNTSTGRWRLAKYTTVTSNTSPTYNVGIDSSVIPYGGHIAAIGNDGTNIVVAKCNSNKKIILYKFNANTGAHISTHTTNAFSSTYPDLSSVDYGTFDLGATNYYSITSRGGTVMVNASTYNEQVGYFFSTPNGKRPTGCAWTGTEFRTLSYDGKLYHHTGLGMNLSTTTRYPTIYLKQTWYDNNATGGLHESPLSITPQSYVLNNKRSHVVLESISNIPNTGGGTDSPNSAGFYISTGASTPDSNYKMQNSSPVTGLTELDLVTIDTAGTTHGGVSEFTGQEPGLITSTSGDSFWSGDDVAQFKNLTLIGTNDANNTGGNLPPLRIGDTNGTHLRIDGNEIIAMDGDATQGTLFLNRLGSTVAGDGAGGGFKIGGNGTYMSCVTTARTVISTNGSGEANVSHGIGSTPEIVLCQMQNAGEIVNVFARSSTTFSVRIFNDAGNPITNASRNLGWMAIKLT